MNPLIVSVLLIIISMYTLYSYTFPKWDEVNLKNEQIAEVDDLLIKASELDSKRTELLNAYNSVSEEIKKEVDRSIPIYSEEEVAILLLDIVKFASTSNVDLESLSFNVAGLGSGEQSVILSFSMTESYFQLKSFLQKLSVWFKGVILESISITPVGDSNDLRASIKLRVFFSNQ